MKVNVPNKPQKTSIIYDESRQKQEQVILQQSPVQYVSTNTQNLQHVQTAQFLPQQYKVVPATANITTGQQYVLQAPVVSQQNYQLLNNTPITQSYIVDQVPVESQQVIYQKPIEIIKEKVIHVDRPIQEYEIQMENYRRQIVNLTTSIEERNQVIDQQKVKIAQLEIQYQQNFNNVQIIRDLESRIAFLNRENQNLIQNKETLLAAIVELEARCNQITDDAMNIEREKRTGNQLTNSLQQEISHLNDLLRQRDSDIILQRQRISQLEAVEIRFKQQNEDISRLGLALDQKERERLELQQNLLQSNQYAYENENLKLELNKLARIIQAKDQEFFILQDKLKNFDGIQSDKLRMEEDIRRLAIIIESKEKEVQRVNSEVVQLRLSKEDNSHFHYQLLERDRQIDDLRVRVQVLLTENQQFRKENEKVIILAQELEKTNQILQNCMVEKDNYKFQLEQNRGNSNIILNYEERIKNLVEEISQLQKKNSLRNSVSTNQKPFK